MRPYALKLQPLATPPRKHLLRQQRYSSIAIGYRVTTSGVNKPDTSRELARKLAVCEGRKTTAPQYGLLVRSPIYFCN